MNKDVYEVPSGAKINALVRELSCDVRITANRYRRLLENPAFLHAEFMEAGGFIHLETYKTILNALKYLGTASQVTINIEECYSYATKIEETYNKRWGLIE